MSRTPDRGGIRSPRRPTAQHDDELSHQKWRPGLCRGPRFQGGHRLEKLRDQHEHIKVQRHRRLGCISRPPSAVQATGISRVENNALRNQRKDTEYVRRQNAMKREEEAGDTDKQRRHHKEPGATIHALC